MISLEILRRIPFFAGLDEHELKSIAMISTQAQTPAGTVLFEEGQTADAFYLMLEGDVTLSCNSPSEPKAQMHIEDVNPGEPFSISGLIPPHILAHTARASSACQTIRINAPALRALCEQDCKVGYSLMRQVAAAAMERLQFTRVQLAAERA